MCSINQKHEKDNEYSYISESFIRLLNNNGDENNSSDTNTDTLINSDNYKNNIMPERNESIIGINACCDDLVKLRNLIDESDCVWQHMLMTELKKNTECKETIKNNDCFARNEENSESDTVKDVEAKIGRYILAHCASSTCRNNPSETHDNANLNSGYYYNILKDEKSGIKFRVEIDVDHANESDGNAASQNDDNDSDGERQTFTHEEAERFQRKLQNTTEPLRNCMQQLQFRENVEYSEQAEIERKEYNKLIELID